MLRSLISQLAESNNGMSISPVMKHEYYKRKTLPIKIEECSDLLAALIKESQQTTFVVDALDECEDTDALLLHLKYLYDIVPRTKHSIRIFFSSRNHIDVLEPFPDCRKLELESCKTLTSWDMAVYIES